jgi:hypothetical protein
MHGTKQRTARCAIKHFLLTIQIAGNEHLHCYLATDDRRDTIDAANRMLSEAEKASVMHPLSSTVGRCGGRRGGPHRRPRSAESRCWRHDRFPLFDFATARAIPTPG